jgi:uncharacterized protein
MKVGSEWSSDEQGRLIIPPGGPRIVDRIGGGAVLMFGSSSLSWRHEEIKRAGAQFEHGEYQPHVTLIYDAPHNLDLRAIEPFRGRLVFGPEIFEEFVEGWRP